MFLNGVDYRRMDVLVPGCSCRPWLLVKSRRLKSVPSVNTVVALATNRGVSPGAVDCLSASLVLRPIFVTLDKLLGGSCN